MGGREGGAVWDDDIFSDYVFVYLLRHPLFHLPSYIMFPTAACVLLGLATREGGGKNLDWLVHPG